MRSVVRRGLLLLIIAASVNTNAGELDSLSAAVVYLRSARPEVRRTLGGEVYEVGIRKPGEDQFKPAMPFLGSGFLVASGKDLFLVTARHVAKDLGSKSGVVLRGDLATPVEVTLQQLAGGDPTTELIWRSRPATDVAVLALRPPSDVLTMLRGHFMPAEMLRAETPSRDVTLTVLGFPLGLGINGPFSPISRETKAASGPMPMGELGTVVLLQDPSIGGFSGAPVFDLRQPTFAAGLKVTLRDGKPRCVGLITATLSDDTGGKLGAMVPAQAIVEILNKLQEPPAEPK